MRKTCLIAAIVIAAVSLGCGDRIQETTQNDAANAKSSNAGDASTPATEANLPMETRMNIREKLNFTDERPAVLSIIGSEKVNLKAIGLNKGQVMSKHKAGLKSLLIVLEGKIEFSIDGEKFELGELDTYEIPVNVEHEIRGIEKSIFSLTQEK